jgi:NADH-quinone oxidoreductase subunit N
VIAPDYTVLLPEFILIATAFIIPAVGYSIRDERYNPILAYIALAGIIISFIFVLKMVWVTLIPWLPDIAYEETLFGVFEMNMFALLFKSVFLGIGFLVVLGSVNYIKKHPNQSEYYTLILLSIVGMMVVASSMELITLFIGLELAGLSTYALAGFIKTDARSTEAATKYFIIGALSSAFLLYGISLVYGIAGSTSFTVIGEVFKSAGDFHTTSMIAIVFLITGFGFKIAVVPFHMWAPDVYEGAPTTITAFLAAGSKKMGFAAMFKLFLVGLLVVKTDWDVLIGIVAIVTMTVGNVIAISQDNIKRMLAYSSIAQAGYILIALPVGTSFALAGGLFHVLTHMFMKGGAFMVVAALYHATGKFNSIEDYRGLHRRSPLMAFAMMIFLLALAGVPPTGGFFSKFVLFSSAVDLWVQTESWVIWLAVAGILNSALSLYYYVRVIKYMYVEKGDSVKRINTGSHLTLAVIIAFAGIILTGILAEPFIKLCLEAAGTLIPAL